MKPIYKVILNLSLYQIGWFVCVIGGNRYAVPYTLIVLALHHSLLMDNRMEWKLIAVVAVIGCSWDFLIKLFGVIDFGETHLIGIPVWLICLWLLFATTFMHGLFWLSQQLWLAALFAAVLGPMTYWFGANLTEVQLGLPVLHSLLIMSLGWALLFPCGIYYAGRVKSQNVQ